MTMTRSHTNKGTAPNACRVQGCYRMEAGTGFCREHEYVYLVEWWRLHSRGNEEGSGDSVGEGGRAP